MERPQQEAEYTASPRHRQSGGALWQETLPLNTMVAAYIAPDRQLLLFQNVLLRPILPEKAEAG